MRPARPAPHAATRPLGRSLYARKSPSGRAVRLTPRPHGVWQSAFPLVTIERPAGRPCQAARCPSTCSGAGRRNKAGRPCIVQWCGDAVAGEPCGLTAVRSKSTTPFGAGDDPTTLVSSAEPNREISAPFSKEISRACISLIVWNNTLCLRVYSG